MSTTLLTVTRRWQTQKTTLSTFKTLVGAGKPASFISGYILEKKRLQPLPVISTRYIPAGIYTLKWHYSARFGRKLPLLYSASLPPSQGIFIHGSNHPCLLDGCLQVGAFMSPDYIGGSDFKLEEILSFLNHYDLDSGHFSVEIKDCFLATVQPNILLTVTRRWQTEKSTISTFDSSIVDTGAYESSIVSGYILEPKGPSTTVQNQNQRIPAGTYHLKWHYGGKFGKKMPLLYNHEVPASRLILIHQGNSPKDTIGCLLVGSARKPDVVENSKTKLKELLEFLNGYDIDSGEFLLKIEENFE